MEGDNPNCYDRKMTVNNIHGHFGYNSCYGIKGKVSSYSMKIHESG